MSKLACNKRSKIKIFRYWDLFTYWKLSMCFEFYLWHHSHFADICRIVVDLMWKMILLFGCYHQLIMLLADRFALCEWLDTMSRSIKSSKTHMKVSSFEQIEIFVKNFGQKMSTTGDVKVWFRISSTRPLRSVLKGQHEKGRLSHWENGTQSSKLKLSCKWPQELKGQKSRGNLHQLR